MIVSKENNASEYFSDFSEILFALSNKKDGDMSWKEGDKATKKNRKKFFDKIGIEEENIVSMHQPHGNKVAVVEIRDKGQKIQNVDALITREPDVFLQVTTADCVPIFLYDPTLKIIGVVHSGWRGTAKNIAGKIVKELIKLGSKPENIMVYLGPSIKKCCYDVPKDRLKYFSQWGSVYALEVENKSYLDLPGICREQLIKKGILLKKIVISPACTCCNNDCYSHHRDKKIEGLMVGIIGRWF